MTIPIEQINRWANQGSITTARLTKDSIKSVLHSNNSPLKEIDNKILLQGSYKNSTNIRGDSDVDVIVQLNKSFKPNISQLSDNEKEKFRSHHVDAKYSYDDFKKDVKHILESHYGKEKIVEGNKSIKLMKSSGRLPADIIACIQYRKYLKFPNKENEKFIEGILFYTKNENRQIINYPKIHFDNGVEKNSEERTNQNYKQLVRIFKNARSYLIDSNKIPRNLAPSYFIECLIYNVPDDKFSNNFQDSFITILNWLNESFSNNEYKKFLCQNEQLKLFGESDQQWRREKAIELIKQLLSLWENWS